MREDNDQWDITSSVGVTALGVAAGRAMETERSDGLVDDPYARPFLDAVGDQAPFPTDGSGADDDLWGAQSTYLGVRSRFFDEFFAEAADAGVRQVVLLAAGLDARAHRLTWPQGTAVYEIDQSAVMEFKDRVLGEQQARSDAERVVVPVDLRHDWPAALTAAGFDPSRPSAWLAEGLLPYLPVDAERLLFDRVQSLSAPGSRMAVEYFAGNFDRFRDDPRMQQFQQKFGVDISDLIYDDPRDDLLAGLSGRGWKVASSRAADLARTWGRPLEEGSVAEAMGASQLVSARLDDPR